MTAPKIKVKPVPWVVKPVPSLKDMVAGEENTWNFERVHTQELTHGLHTYLAAMIPQLSHRLLEKYVPAKGTVLDPFCGGWCSLS